MANEEKLNTSELKIGMYVTKLDRPWLETSFLLQGFYLSSEKDIKLMQKECEYVYIDPIKDRQAKYAMERLQKERRSGADRRSLGELGKLQSQVTYKDITPVEEEIEAAREVHKEMSVSLEDCMDRVRSGKILDMRGLQSALTEMKKCIVRNPNALLLLSKLKNKDSYTYSHCLDSSALCIAFGRHLGFSSQNLDDLAIGALMCDIGKSRVPDEILSKPERLTDDEYALMQQHVSHSVAILQEAGNVNRAAIEIVSTHHERFDGSGYPRGLKQDAIPVLGQIAAIVDCYDAMTSDKIYSPAVSPSEAIRRLFGWAGVFFQRELVDAFIQAIGIYAVGSFVELSTGQVAIVIGQNQLRRLRPKVMVVLDENKNSVSSMSIIDLLHETADARDNPLEVKRSIDPNDFGLDPRDFYI
jgi:HD-GYP domain-containing protein (c-di-GMP phosphodiesterase class II)